MLRPEAVELRPPGTAGVTDGVNRLHGVVHEAHYMGAHTEYHVHAGGGLIKVHSPLDFESGAPVIVAFEAESCRLISAAAQ
jgi:ABC-type Fe3+/spermidine/putrescine transport system ATPase subunit